MLQIIERSLPKKPKLKKDPSVIEKEEMEKISKCWVNIARKEIPKQHRIFLNFHKKQLTEAKRISETCQREVCSARNISLEFVVFLYLFGTLLLQLLTMKMLLSCFVPR